MTRRFLALDLGAESGRAILAELARGRIELHELHRFANTPVQLPSGLYWDTLRLFHEICEGIRIAARAGELHGIAVDTWGVDFALTGASGELLDNPRHYRDPRTIGLTDELCKLVPRSEIFERTGIQFMDINSLCQLAAVQRDSPRLLHLAAKLLFMPDLFNYFLTGVSASERTIASTSQFYDPAAGTFDSELLKRVVGIEPHFLCDLIEPATQLGKLLPHVADTAAPVYATASHDTASAVAAVPALDGIAWCYISSGTWSLMGVELNQPLINDAAREANFTNEVGIKRTIRFLKNIPGLWVMQECRRAWAREGQEFTYPELMERAAAAKPSATVIDLDEFTSPGNYPTRICECCRKTGQEIPQDPGAMVRVILQSLAARYKEVLSALEQLSHRSIEIIHIVGGGSRNKLLNQLTANVTGRRVVAGPAEATAAGNALVQALGTHDIGSLSELRDVARRSFELHVFVPE
jgi:rhamnulokinase